MDACEQFVDYTPEPKNTYDKICFQICEIGFWDGYEGRDYCTKYKRSDFAHFYSWHYLKGELKRESEGA